MDFYFNSWRNILFAKLRLASARIRGGHPRLPQILSAKAANLSPGPNVFYTSVTTRITFMHPPFVDTRVSLFSLFRRSFHPSRVRSFVRSSRSFAVGNLFSTHERVVIGQANRTTRSTRVLRRCLIFYRLFCDTEGA